MQPAETMLAGITDYSSPCWLKMNTINEDSIHRTTLLAFHKLVNDMKDTPHEILRIRRTRNLSTIFQPIGWVESGDAPGEHLDSDAETEIDDNNDPVSSVLLDVEA
ncbi:hypothetical protein Tco_1538001 [Tanacetum coccineum]